MAEGEGGFFGIGSTLIDAHTLSGQTEGLKVGCGWVGGGMGGFKEWVDWWMNGWAEGEGVGKGGVWV